MLFIMAGKKGWSNAVGQAKCWANTIRQVQYCLLGPFFCIDNLIEGYYYSTADKILRANIFEVNHLDFLKLSQLSNFKYPHLPLTNPCWYVRACKIAPPPPPPRRGCTKVTIM